MKKTPFKVASVRSDPPKKQKNHKDDQDDPDDTDATVTVAVSVSAKPATEAASQENDKNN